MSISFNQIPNGLRVPFVAAEFDSSRASQGPSTLDLKALIIGQKMAAGEGVANSLERITSADDARRIGGAGSMLHRQAIAWFASNTSTELWLGILDDPGAGVAASGTITVTGPATAAGTIALYMSSKRIQVGVADAATPTEIAASIAAAINADTDLAVTALAAAAVVTVTVKNAGLAGNGYDMRDNYRDGARLPDGVGLAYVAIAGGTAATDLAPLIATMGDTWYHILSHPYTDAPSLTTIETEMASRFGPLRMIDGVAITSASGTFAELAAIGAARNSQHSVIAVQPGKLPVTHAPEFAAEVAAVVAAYAPQDFARPLQTLPMRHAVQPAEADLFNFSEHDQLLKSGIATTKDSAGGVVRLERLITTYQTNSSGADDTSYLDITTLLTLMYLRYSFRTRMMLKYGRHKLADDDANIGVGQAVITPKAGRGEAVGWFTDMELLGLLEGKDQFKRDLVVERNASDPNRLDFLLPPDLINQLLVTGVQIAFRI